MGDLLRPYRAVLASRIRAQRAYRTSFRADLFGTALVGLTEMAEVIVLFSAANGTLGGLDLMQALLVFGLAELAFSNADMMFGHVDSLAQQVRAGTVDVLYLRPQPLLAQLVTSDISLRRLGRTALAVVVLIWALAANDIDWGPRAVALLALALVCGFAIFCANFVAAGGLQFFLLNAEQVTNAFVYGGRHASTQPATVWVRGITVIFGFVFPMAFCAYLPAMLLLGEPGADWLPAWLGWFAPVAALWAWILALLAWRAGVRHYQGGGG
ncbi:ABC transporter permease [Myceligenerans pegani]|uniref:ABC-2 family transporter protein n=1 Tax=Myceligenerans pegani TaxID=2776917 RepID=A0ABR9MV89_9MICO|nr:ABC-2 family transporter protein [Myceligenerans sp. TRM 65318]MBE1875307.1 ABC-2 family transporter protein [Myceligenerans sp. TRM 65318]MBE3017578.1 ABC-2 family transporter protein [Myceligenerans sp. TRM 65318]